VTAEPQANKQLVWETRDGKQKKLTIENNPDKRNCSVYTGYKP